MWKDFVKDYLSFTRKDRIGVIVLVTLIFIVVLLPYVWPARKNRPVGKEEMEKIRAQTALLNKPGDASSGSPGIKEEGPAPYPYPSKRNAARETAAVFYFDPNTLNAAGWRRLGIREKTVTTIMNYLARGGKFRRPEDISKIYGLFKDDCERLLPYVKIAGQAGFETKYHKDKKEFADNEKPLYPARRFPVSKTVEINTADTSAFIALPGIGSKLAARIISFRDKLGGFYSVQQVAETYGLPDSVFGKIKALLQCSDPSVQQIDINTADANTLKQHPYIRWNLANAIVQYRAQHGNFTSVNDLQQLALITPEIFQQIKPYLKL